MCILSIIDQYKVHFDVSQLTGIVSRISWYSSCDKKYWGEKASFPMLTMYVSFIVIGFPIYNFKSNLFKSDQRVYLNFRSANIFFLKLKTYISKFT